MKLAVVIFVGLVSVLGGEIAMTTWLDLTDRFMDVTGNFWLQGIVPVVFTVVLVQALLLWPIYRADPVKYGIAYAAAYALCNALELNFLGNPIADIATYVVTDLAIAVLVIGVLNQLFWKTPRATAA